MAIWFVNPSAPKIRKLRSIEKHRKAAKSTVKTKTNAKTTAKSRKPSKPVVKTTAAKKTVAMKQTVRGAVLQIPKGRTVTVRVNPEKRSNKMARRKLYGAALAAHLKRVGRKNPKRRRYRRNGEAESSLLQAAKGTYTSTAKPSKTSKKTQAKPVAAKTARKPRAKKTATVAAKAARKPRAKKTVQMRRKMTRTQALVKARKVRRIKALTSWQGVRKPKGKQTKRLYKNKLSTLRVKAYGSPAARRYAALHRINPGVAGVKGAGKALMNAVKVALPYAGAFYATRFAASWIATKATNYVAEQAGLARADAAMVSTETIWDTLNAQSKWIRPAISVGLVGAMHFAGTKVPQIKKYYTGLMVGSAINAFDSVLRAVAAMPNAPVFLQSLLGVGDDEGVYDRALSTGDYVEEPSYGSAGALGDYVETGAYEETGSLGDYIETGAFEEIGGCGTGMCGLDGVITKQIPRESTRTLIPQAADESNESFYTGIFSGGFGS